MKKNKNRILPFLATLLFFGMLSSVGFSTQARAFGDDIGLSPYWDWKTTESEHFKVTFPEDLGESVPQLLEYLEKAHHLLTPFFYWQPRQRTHVLLVDNADTANGMAAASLRFGMVLFLTPPESWFSTNYYDDWLWMLVVHEYAHILNMDPTDDWMEVLRYIFGDAIRPNALWPSWMLEGIGVYIETRYTKGGRGRSRYYDMVIRAAVEEGILGESNFITLDKVNGPNPYFPAGETPYLFGYELINQIAKDRSLQERNRTFDQKSSLKDGEDLIGQMSMRSAGRVPFFVNGNLENLSEKDWYQYWDEWLQDARDLSNQQLQKIKSQPITSHQLLTQNFLTSFGAKVSPDGKWLAFTGTSSDDRSALYLKNLKDSKAKLRRLMDKRLGVGIAFSPDSRFIFFSSARKHAIYYLKSDLGAYDLENEEVHWLTQAERAKDPDVSYDGRQIVYTTNSNTRSELVVANLIRKEQQEGLRFLLESKRTIYTPNRFDRVSQPKFSPDGRTVVFSLHRNGSFSEELLEIDIRNLKVKTIVSNGAFNRFPTFNRRGDLYYVSDRSGVDNLYVYLSNKSPQAVTNFTTGLWFPTFSPDGDAYGSFYTNQGWQLAQFHPETVGSSAKLRLKTLPKSSSPEPHSKGSPPQEPFHQKLSYEDYSPFPSLLPRSWGPFGLFESNGEQFRSYVGGIITGFDSLDEHRYTLFGAYDFLVKEFDWLVSYTNRSLGPQITALAGESISSFSFSGSDYLSYKKSFEAGLKVSYRIPFTWSALTPSLAFRWERDIQTIQSGSSVSISRSAYVPTIDTGLSYSDRFTTKLGITHEKGRLASIASRIYLLDNGRRVLKLLAQDKEHFQLMDHVVLEPSFTGSYVSHQASYLSSNVVMDGSYSVFEKGTEQSLKELSFRGYPLTLIYARAGAVVAADLKFPILRIFRGWGTNPAFLTNLYGFTFGEATFFQFNQGTSSILPSVGGGLRLATQLFLRIPIEFSLEYHKGLKEEYGGKDDFRFGVFFQTSLFGAIN